MFDPHDLLKNLEIADAISAEEHVDGVELKWQFSETFDGFGEFDPFSCSENNNRDFLTMNDEFMEVRGNSYLFACMLFHMTLDY